MERFYEDPCTPLRMREGPLGAYVDAFAQHLSDDGYAKASSRYALQLVADLGRWLHRRKITAQQITSEHLGRYLQYRRRCGRHHSGDAAIVRRLFSLLLDQGIVAHSPPIEPTPAERLEEQFRLYLERERRLAPATCFTIWCSPGAFSRNASPMEGCGWMLCVRPMWWALSSARQLGCIIPNAPS